ncbi:MAG: hypothetical protein IQL11_15580, partial [Bacteroidales bacterium]|nr:hypothetical protein [Bacteroidales bacterium]
MKKAAISLLLILTVFSGRLSAQQCVTVGPNDTICQGSTTSGLGGVIVGDATSAAWSTTSGGTFSPDANSLNATWTPPADFTGTAILTLTASGGTCTPVSASKLVIVNPTPVSPALSTASPVVSSVICAGYSTGTATFTGGAGEGTNEYEYSIDGGTNWNSYVNGAAIITTGGTNSVQVRARRSGGECPPSAYNTYTIWTFGTPTVNPVLNSATPASGTLICAGYNGPNAIITAGSGGSAGAADLYEYSINNGGTWLAYTSGATINTTGASTNVLIRVSRSGGNYGCSSTGPAIIVTWPIAEEPVAPTLGTASPADGTTICAGFNTGTVTGTGGSGGSTGAVNEFQVSIDGGGNYTSYTSGSAIVTTGATGSVIVQTRRTGGSYGCTATAWSTICTWPLAALPVAPTLGTATPANGTTICAGFNTGNVTGTGGSGGSTGAVNEYQVSTNGGGSYTSYISGSAIVTTGASGSVIVQARRTGGSYGCTATAWSTICTWPVSSLPVAPTLGTATPADGTTICAGFNTGTVTGTGGSGGSTGAVNEYQVSIDGGVSYTSYTNGSAIVTTGATGSVIVQARRTGGSYGCTATAWSTICTWPIGILSTAPTGVAITNNNSCNGTVKTLTVTGGSLGTDATWQWFTGSCGGTQVGTGSSIDVDPAAGTGTTYYVLASGLCNTTTCASGTVVVTPTVGTPTTPTPSATTICQGSANTTYTTSATDAISYNWSVTGTGNTISGTGTTGTVTWAPGFSGTATITVAANGCSGPSAPTSTIVTVR